MKLRKEKVPTKVSKSQNLKNNTVIKNINYIFIYLFNRPVDFQRSQL